MAELIFLLVFEVFGPIILIGLAVWAFIMFRRGARLKKSLDASRDNAAAMAMEGMRVKATAIGILAFVLGGAAFCLMLMAGMELAVSVPVGLVVYGAMTFWSRSLRGAYNAMFKDTFVASELSKVFTNLDYRPGEKFDAATLRELHFFMPFDDLDGSDLMTAEYKGMRFTQSDISLLRRWTETTRNSDGETREVERSEVFFKGRVMRFDFTTAFKGEVQVVKRDFGQARVAQTKGEWQTVETELAELGEDYRIFAKDPTAAMTVLSPQMIEGIYFLEKKLRVPLALYFTGHSMFVFMALARDAFDASKKKTLLEERELLQNDIALITGFLETMYFKGQAAPTAPAAELSGAGGAVPGPGVPIPLPIPLPGPVASPKDARSELPLPGVGGGTPESLQRMGYKVAFAGKLAGRVLCFTPLALYLASVLYTLMSFPDGFSLSYSSSGDTTSLGDSVPTLGYVIVASFFIVPAALGGGFLLQKALASLLGGGGSGFSFNERVQTAVKSVGGALLGLLPFWVHLFFLNANMLYR